MANPFTTPESLRMLVPWQNEADLDLYLDIDNHLPSVEQFDKEIEFQSPLNDGLAILIHGKTGCGKTALAHRLVHRVAERYRDRTASVPIVDLGSEDGQVGSAIEARLRSHRQLVCDGLRRQGVIEQEEFNVLQGRVDEDVLFGSMLREILDRTNALLVLILPPLELEAELERLVPQWRRRRVIAVYTTASDAVADRSAQQYGPNSATPVVRLNVGPLRHSDGWTFVYNRLMRLPDGDRPSIDEAVLRDYMKARMENSEVSIRELQRTCAQVFDYVLRAGKSEVLLSDFAEYWMRIGLPR